MSLLSDARAPLILYWLPSNAYQQFAICEHNDKTVQRSAPIIGCFGNGIEIGRAKMAPPSPLLPDALSNASQQHWCGWWQQMPRASYHRQAPIISAIFIAPNKTVIIIITNAPKKINLDGISFSRMHRRRRWWCIVYIFAQCQRRLRWRLFCLGVKFNGSLQLPSRNACISQRFADVSYANSSSESKFLFMASQAIDLLHAAPEQSSDGGKEWIFRQI